jgi:hypothetical protein
MGGWATACGGVSGGACGYFFAGLAAAALLGGKTHNRANSTLVYRGKGVLFDNLLLSVGVESCRGG